MLSDKALAAMRDIVTHGKFAVEYSRSAKAGNAADRAKAIFAVVRCLEIVSEASRRLPESLKQTYPLIP